MSEALSAKKLRQIRGKILRAAEVKLTQDLKAYLHDYQDLIIFTYAEGGGLVIGIEALMPDGSSAIAALQDALHGPAEPVAEDADADAPPVPAIQVVSR